MYDYENDKNKGWEIDVLQHTFFILFVASIVLMECRRMSPEVEQSGKDSAERLSWLFEWEQTCGTSHLTPKISGLFNANKIQENWTSLECDNIDSEAYRKSFLFREHFRLQWIEFRYPQFSSHLCRQLPANHTLSR